VNLAFHDAQFASAGFFGLTRGIASSGRSRSSRTSDTPVASRRLHPCCRTVRLSWSPRPLPSSLREDETLSTTRGAFHRWGTPTLMREPFPVSWRGHVCFRDDPGPRHPFARSSYGSAFALPQVTTR